MRVISAFAAAPARVSASPAQDDVIERILKSIGKWNPPWLRERKIRGAPPRQIEMFSQERPELADEFDQTPPGDDWICRNHLTSLL